MASRKEQKEQLREEREEREEAAKAAVHRRRLIGYGAAGALVLVVLIVGVVLLVGNSGGSGGGGGKSGTGDVLPDGGKVPEQKITDLNEAVEAAGCELKSFKGTSRDHTSDLAEKVTYASKPPTSGKHFDVPTEDGEYEKSPDPKELLHALEHGRVIISLKKSLPQEQRANLKALFDEDTYQMIITPDKTGMTYAVAATAWSAEPQPNGTGRLLGCPKVTSEVYDAIRTFKDEHRSNGPENVD